MSDPERATTCTSGDPASRLEVEDTVTGHIEQIRQRYDQFSRGDIRGATEEWADDFVWEGGNCAALPMGGTHHGKAAALGVLARDVAVWDEFTMSVEEYFEDGDTVVVLGHSVIKKDGQPATTAFVHIWRWHGDQIVRFQLVTDTLQLAQLLGLAADQKGTAHVIRHK